MAEVNPRYQDDWLVLIGGPQLCKTSFGVNCQLLWIWENKSRFSERELRKVLGPYNIWTHKHSTYHWPLKFPFYNKACLKDLARMIDEKELLDFQNFVIHDQLKHLILGESRDDSQKFQMEPLKALNRFRMIVEYSIQNLDPPDLEEKFGIIWIEALKNIKKKMMARSYDTWYLNQICRAQLEHQFQNPLDIVDGMLKRASEAHARNSNSSASATGPDLSIATSIPTLGLNQIIPLLDDQPPPYSSITNDEVCE